MSVYGAKFRVSYATCLICDHKFYSERQYKKPLRTLLALGGTMESQ